MAIPNGYVKVCLHIIIGFLSVYIIDKQHNISEYICILSGLLSAATSALAALHSMEKTSSRLHRKPPSK